MATTSIWRVKGWLGKVVIYAENPEKTANPKFYADRELTEQDGQQLSDVIRYAVNSEKTQETGSEDGAPLHRFVSGINCSPATARDEMLAVKKRFGKEDGTVAYHGYQSFAPGEATPELAHEIGVKLATRLWGDRYQVIVATHLDKENHLHNHFVVNTVSFADGIKYHRTRKDYHEMQTVSDELCREYGLSVIEHPQQGRGKQYGEWRAEQEQRPTWRGLIRSDIDEAIRQAMPSGRENPLRSVTCETNCWNSPKKRPRRSPCLWSCSPLAHWIFSDMKAPSISISASSYSIFTALVNS